MEKSGNANPYIVEPRQTTVPLGFHDLPREVQSMVIKHTHARFVVTHHTGQSPVGLAYNPHNSNTAAKKRAWLLFWESRLDFVPVVNRYEFNLQRRRGEREPEMTARFSRWLDPALKETDLWRSCPPIFQEGIERAAAQVVNIEPFSHLKFDELKPGNGSRGLFCFLRKNGQQSLAPQWSNFSIEKQQIESQAVESQFVVEVREKMQKVFGQAFSHV